MEKALNAQINAGYDPLTLCRCPVHFSAKGIEAWPTGSPFGSRRSRIVLRFSSITCSRAWPFLTLAPIAEVPCEWESPLAAFEATLVHEKKVTAMIDALCRQAEADKDFATANKLVWFVDEQGREEGERSGYHRLVRKWSTTARWASTRSTRAQRRVCPRCFYRRRIIGQRRARIGG